MIRTMLICGSLGLMVCGALGAAEGSEASAPASSSEFMVPLEDNQWMTEEIEALSRWLRVPGSVLRPRSNTVSFTASGGGGCTYHTGGSTSTVWNTYVYPPQGVTVNFVRMYFDDTSASDSTGWFTIYDLYGGIVQEWAVSSTGSSGNFFNDTAAIDHVVDYSLYSYVVNWRPNVTGLEMQLCGFRIFYDQ